MYLCLCTYMSCCCCPLGLLKIQLFISHRVVSRCACLWERVCGVWLNVLWQGLSGGRFFEMHALYTFLYCVTMVRLKCCGLVRPDMWVKTFFTDVYLGQGNKEQRFTWSWGHRSDLLSLDEREMLPWGWCMEGKAWYKSSGMGGVFILPPWVRNDHVSFHFVPFTSSPWNYFALDVTFPSLLFLLVLFFIVAVWWKPHLQNRNVSGHWKD